MESLRNGEILQNFINSRLSFIESVHEKYQWKAHQPPKAPSMGVILVKNPCYSDEKIQTIIFTKIFEKNVLGPFDQSAYIHMRNLMKYFGAEVTVYFFPTGTENPFIIA